MTTITKTPRTREDKRQAESKAEREARRRRAALSRHLSMVFGGVLAGLEHGPAADASSGKPDRQRTSAA